jgi:hypothetical protein
MILMFTESIIAIEYSFISEIDIQKESEFCFSA